MNASVPALAIVYVGTLNSGGTCLHRRQTLAKLGHRVTALDTVPGPIAARRATFAWRVRNRLFGAFDESRANERLRDLPASLAPDVVWMDKPLTIERDTLLALRAKWPGAIFLTYSGDDMFNPRNQSRQWWSTLPLWDLHVTTKSFNVPELRRAGARDVLHVEKGFSPEVHHPHPVTPGIVAALGADVGFIGWPEGERERSMRYLARHGVPVRVWGPWPRWKSAANFRVEGRPLWDADYARSISATRVNLGFLRKVNRDRHTTRSVEIPACGGFLLAERTDEHRALFREDVEAVFFESDRELLEKTRHYLAHEQDRARIAEAGWRRCREGGYAHDHRLTGVLAHALARRAALAA